MTWDEGSDPELDDDEVRAAVTTVLDGEGIGDAVVSVTFLGGPAMRDLNRRSFSRDYATDVIAYPLQHPGRLVGDVYVCPAAAQRSGSTGSRPTAEEVIRLVVHGTLHVVGYDHPDGDDRETSPMWERQERYVATTCARRP